MSSNSHDPIYNQDDMEVVLAALRKAEKEAEHSKQLLWAVIEKVGGEVAIPYAAWMDNKPIKELVMWDDKETLQMHRKIQEVGDV